MIEKTWFFGTGVIVLLAAAFALVTGDAWAQGATPAPLAKVTVSAEVAKRTLNKMVINADAARAIVDSCVEWTKAQGGNVSIAIFVIAPTGEIIDSHTMDGVLPIGAETGLLKAKTALYARRRRAPSRSASITSMAGSFGWTSGGRKACPTISSAAACRSSSRIS